MLKIQPLDPYVPIQAQLNTDASPVTLVNIFTVNSNDIESLLEAWEQDANWMKKQPGYIFKLRNMGISRTFSCSLHKP